MTTGELENEARSLRTKTPGPAPLASTASAPPAAQSATQQVVSQQAFRVDDSKAPAYYANFCRVTGTPEELILDFALNSQPMGVSADALVVGQRCVVNFFTAKRLLQALKMSLQRHEAMFGVLETNVQTRVQGARG